jgi:hypothetical protein
MKQDEAQLNLSLTVTLVRDLPTTWVPVAYNSKLGICLGGWHFSSSQNLILEPFLVENGLSKINVLSPPSDLFGTATWVAALAFQNKIHF